ncbi:MAG: 3-oxoacyl-[acyl-carrier-protein] reductase [Acidobacteriota bacterium]|nr:3-oxoacyl-[acyl-carrier-protein] reductase [Acidobacteriota bacterium]
MTATVWPGLRGRRVLVTGGSRGIGRSIVDELARSGAEVVLTSRTFDRADEVAQEMRAAGHAARGLALDLSDPARAAESLAELVAETKADGGVPLLVHNAGITRDGLLMRMSLKQWDEVLQANLTGAFVVTKALLPGMIRARHGRVVVVSSVVARMGNAGQANYAASKAGLHGFVRAIAREVGSRGITVNAIAPGYIDTEMTRALPDAARERLLKLVPLGRLGEPGDVASAIGFLLSDAASYITGEVLDVNGGMDM